MTIEILMPALSPTMEEGNLAKWVKKEGDNVAPGDVIAEIETDKATMEVEAIDEGKLGKILIKEGTEGVKVNELIALLLEDGEDKKALDSYKPKNAAKTDNPAQPEKKEEAQKSEVRSEKLEVSTPTSNIQHPTSALGERTKASPLAKRLASQAGIPLTSIQGTGPHGRIIKDDVITAKSGGSLGGHTTGQVFRNQQEFTSVKNNNIRKVIAKRLVESKQTVPHFYLNIDCELDSLLQARKDINDAAAVEAPEGSKPAYKLSVNDFIIKACALALRKVPSANASWTDEAILKYNNVDISVAVAIDGGLITPIIQNADQKSVTQISAEMKQLISKAKAGTLQPEEFQGGSFSLSNLGMYGIKNFSAIINPPQGCILAVGAGEERAVVKNSEIKTATLMDATLSCDHRVVDGAVGAQFLAAFKEYIQKPALLLI